MVRYALLRTVLDPMLAVSGPGGLARLEFLPKAWEYHTRAHAIARELYPEVTRIKEAPHHFQELHGQLAEYFIGRRSDFTIDLHLLGSDFQVKVWTQLLKIPYGKVRTYGQIARSMRKPTAFRAVGQAAGHNPLPILVPCHRVVGKGGSLVGFAGGITTKARLLRLEGHTLDAARIEEPRLF
jgi:AraC family transcriptional regulator of adaptative response/methylated-DNA-[protein]-cysteine methyltransferase